MGEPQRKAALLEPGGGAHLAWLGARLRYLAVGEQTARRFAVSVGTLPPGGGADPYVRNRDHEGLFVLSGELTVSAGDRTLTVPTGGFLNIAPETARRVGNAGPEPAEVLAISGPAGFDEFQFRAGLPLSRPDEPAPAVTDEDRESAAALAPGYGIETAMTVDAVRAGYRLREVELDLAHRATGRSLGGFIHRARQLRDIARAYRSRRRG